MTDLGRITHRRLMHRGDDGAEFNADDVPILDLASLITATDVEGALAELAGLIGAITAAMVSYDPSSTLTPLVSTDVQSAISELDGLIAGLGSAVDAFFEYDQVSPSASWSIAHGLGKFPSVTVVDSAGTVVEGDITYVDDNNVTVDFAGAFSGKAYCN